MSATSRLDAITAMLEHLTKAIGDLSTKLDTLPIKKRESKRVPKTQEEKRFSNIISYWNWQWETNKTSLLNDFKITEEDIKVITEDPLNAIKLDKLRAANKLAKETHLKTVKPVVKSEDDDDE